jgi:uncharacterized small protein (DUF1192 family)
VRCLYEGDRSFSSDAELLRLRSHPLAPALGFSQVCRLGLVIIVGLMSSVVLPAWPATPPPPMYGVPPDINESGGCHFSLPRDYYQSPDLWGPTPDFYSCTNDGPYQKYLKDRTDKIAADNQELSRLSAERVATSEQKQHAQYEMDHPRDLADLRSAQTTYISASNRLAALDCAISYLQDEIAALQTEMAKTKEVHDRNCNTSKQPGGKDKPRQTSSCCPPGPGACLCP